MNPRAVIVTRLGFRIGFGFVKYVGTLLTVQRAHWPRFRRHCGRTTAIRFSEPAVIFREHLWPRFCRDRGSRTVAGSVFSKMAHFPDTSYYICL